MNKRFPAVIFFLIASSFIFSFSMSTRKYMYKYILKSLPPALTELFPKKPTIYPLKKDYKTKKEIINRIKYLTSLQIKDLKKFPSFKMVINRFLELISLFERLNDYSLYINEKNDNSILWYANDFKKYVNLKKEKFVPIFYGFSKILFENHDLDTFLNSICRRNEILYLKLTREYEKGGNSNTFDDRSSAFGIASIIYSRTITDSVNLIVYIWWKSNGDTARTPFFNFNPIYFNVKKEKGDNNVKN